MYKIVKLSVLTAIVCCRLYAFAQTPAPQNNVKLFFEKVFVHTDRSVYAAGEDMWFKTYVTNGQDNHLISTSKNLYVELIAPGDSIVNKQVLYISNGAGNGDFALRGGLPAGIYRLRAYTNWQRNFGDNFVFEKAITITNASAATGALAKTAKTPKKNTAGTIANASPVPVIRFFPEGGALVNELSAIVAVKAEDASGKGISVTGPVISSAGDTVTRFTCDSAGLGEFAILPLAGQTYHTRVIYNGQTITAQLPAALNSGLNLKAVRRDTFTVITVSCNTAGAAAFAGKSLGLVVKHAGVTCADQQFQLNGNVATIKINDNILPEGIAAITVYDNQHKPNCERLIYIEHRGQQARLTVNTNKTIYRSREKVTVNIKATDAGKRPVSGNFSMAAVDAGVDKNENNNITAYMMLQSEIKGQIAYPVRYFDTTNVNRAKQLDLLLLTQGWRDFVWRRLADTAIKISYLPEQGFSLTGIVTKEGSKTVIPKANVTLSIPKARDQKIFFTQTNQNGSYFFDNLQLSGQQVVTVTTRDDKGNANGSVRLDSLSGHGLPVDDKQLDAAAINTELADQISKRASANKQLDSVTSLKEVKVSANKVVRLRDQDATPSGYADEVLTVTAQDVKDFRTLKEYILYASKQARPEQNGDYGVIFVADGKTYHPRFIVDNKEEVFTDEDMNDASVLNHYYQIYYELPMDKVEKVVIKRLLNNLKIPNSAKLITGTRANITGLTTSAGGQDHGINFLYVIYLTLKPGALLKNGGGVTSSIIQGYYEARNFYKPIHEGASDSSKPDMRNTIHWEPVIKTDVNGQATVSFYNADPKTNIRVVVQGVTDKGEPVNAVKGYAVK